MSKNIWPIKSVSVAAGVVLVTCLAMNEVMGTPVFNPDGSITCGSNSIYLNSNGFLTINAGNVNMSGRMALFKIDPATKERAWFTTISLGEKSLKIDAEKKQAVFKGIYHHKETGKSMETGITVSLDADGMVNVETWFNPAELFKDGLLAGGYVYFTSPYDNFIGHTLKVGDRVIALKAGTEREAIDLRGVSDQIVCFADNPEIRVAFLPDKRNAYHLSIGKTDTNFYLSLYRFKLDLGIKEQAEEKTAGTPANYYPTDDLHGPRYDLCRNLVQNSSFETGYRYWGQFSANFPDPGNFRIDSDVSFLGKKSLRLYGRKGQRIGMGYPSTFAIPVEPGKDYTLSFYARGDSVQKLKVNSQEGLGNPLVLGNRRPALKGDVLLSSDWKRYSFSFTAKDNIMSVIFNIEYPTQDCTAWIDCVQLEKGKLTEYTEKPVCAELVTDHFDNLFKPGEAMNACLEIHTLPEMKGSVELTLKNFFGEEVYKDKLEFAADGEGLALCTIPFERQKLFSGAYVLKADFTLDSGYNDQDWFRLGIMDYLDNKFKHKNMFSVCIPATTNGVEDRIQRLKRSGIGAVLISGFSIPEPKLLSELNKNDVLVFSSIFRLGDYVGESPSKEELDKDYRKGPKEWMVGEQCGVRPGEKGFDPDIIPLPAVAESCRKKAEMHPEMKYWKLVNEPPGIMRDNLNAAKKYVAIMKAAYDGIKRGNPNAVVISPDSSMMSWEVGIGWMDTYLKAGGIKTFDIAAIHIYRKRPEEPDLDTDIAVYISMLKKHGYTGDIWFTEGFAFTSHIIPAYSFDPDFSVYTSDYRAGSLSYGIGYGEKLAAAYSARTWLASLKYSSRVKMNLAWAPVLTDMDFNMTPHVDIWAPNTLGHILGNADYCRDIMVSDDVRCYVFEDEHKQPVAVFWNTSPAVDRKVRKGPVLILPFQKNEVEVIDFMGKGAPLADNRELSITPFPVFVRGKAGTTTSFCKRLSEDLGGSDVTRIKPMVKVVGMEKAEVHLQNVLSSRVKGRLSIQCEGKNVVDEKLSFEGKEARMLSVPLSQSTNIFEKRSLKISFLPEGQSQAQVKDVSFILLASKKRKGAITIDGDLADWEKEFAVSLPDTFIDFPVPPALVSKFTAPLPWKGKADLSAVLYSCWDEENLYMAVKVKDDVFAGPPETAGAYKYDSLQVYFDTLCDARERGNFKGFDENDYNYNFNPLEGGLEARRDWVPDRQIAFLAKGPAPEVKRAFRKVSDGMIYEFAFPAKQIFPIALKSGSSFGFALLINDNDNDYRKRGLTLTPQGTEPYMRPDLYPVMCLE